MQVLVSENYPTVYSVYDQEFKNNFLIPEKPCIIKNWLDNYEAYHKWTYSFFRELAGDVSVGVFDNSPAYRNKSFKKAHRQMRFSEYLDHIEQGPTDIRLFLFDLIKHKPKLKYDFFYPEIDTFFLRSFPFLFFGGTGSSVRLHQDMDFSNVFLMQFQGIKRVVLFHPQYSRLLYRMPFNVHSEIDLAKPDDMKYPGLEHVNGVEFILYPGDTLFIPSGYWHYIEYIEGGFSMSLRSLSSNLSNIITGLTNVAIKTHIDEMLSWMFKERWTNYKIKLSRHRANKEIELLKQFPDYYRKV
jgi:hypothetical protein